jgi:hypothetical protein
MAQPGTTVAPPAVASRAWRSVAVRRGARRLAGLSNRARPRPRCAANAEISETFTIVGASGRVGTALCAVCASAGVPHIPVRRDTDDGVFEGTKGPIFIATHASDLDAVVRRVPRERHRDLVFLQGGLLRDGWLERRGLRRATQAALYLAAGTDTETGAMRDGGGASVAHGPRASDVVRLLALGGVACAAVDEETFAKKALEKLLWASSFWVLCAAGRCDDGDDGDGSLFSVSESVRQTRAGGRDRGVPLSEKTPITVGEIVDGSCVATKARAERLLGELFDVAATRRDFAFLTRSGEDARLSARSVAIENAFAYSRSIPSAVPSREMASREAPFRNGWFLMGANETLHETLHARLLRRVGADPGALAADAAETHAVRQIET